MILKKEAYVDIYLPDSMFQLEMLNKIESKKGGRGKSLFKVADPTHELV
jgi:hypothetical protein